MERGDPRRYPTKPGSWICRGSPFLPPANMRQRRRNFSPGLRDITSATRRVKRCSRSGSCCRCRPNRPWRWPKMTPRLCRMRLWRRREPRPAAPYFKRAIDAKDHAFDRERDVKAPASWLKSHGRSLIKYHLHPETKFWGGEYDQRGPLRRRHVSALTHLSDREGGRSHRGKRVHRRGRGSARTSSGRRKLFRTCSIHFRDAETIRDQ